MINRTRHYIDKERSVFWEHDVCFEDCATDEKVQGVIAEVANVEAGKLCLMTKEALCMFIGAPDYIYVRLTSMPIGTSFEFDGFKITRFTGNTYRGSRC